MKRVKAHFARLASVILAAGLIAGIPVRSAAGEGQIPEDAVAYGGHYYKAYTLNKTWTEAKEYCESLGGHLMTVNSAGEQSLLSQLGLKSRYNYWLGGIESDEGKWTWVTGEKWNYTSWGNGQPDNSQKDTRVAEAYLQACVDWSYAWNDSTNKQDKTASPGFICEWEENLVLTSDTWNLGWEKDGETVTGQSVYVSVSGNNNHTATYSSSNTGVATVSSRGKVTAVGVGDTVIKATTSDGQSVEHVMHVHPFPFKWEDPKTALDNSNSWIAKLIRLYYQEMDTDADAAITALEEGMETVITVGMSVTGKKMDDEAEKAFREKINEIVKGFRYDVSSYANVKTSEDLAKKVLEEMADDESGEFTFTCNDITYTCTYKVTAKLWGLILSINPDGIKASNGVIYPWAIVTKNSKSVEAEMIYLKQFADLKISEAREAAYSDAAAILGLDEFFRIVRETCKGKAGTAVKNRFPDLWRLAEGANALKSKVDDVNKAYKKLTPPDWTGDLGSQVIEDISGYHEKVYDLIDAVEALVP